MKKIKLKNIAILFAIVLITSCSPQSKESYLKRYEKFISEVKMNSTNYTEADWIKIDEKFERFSKEWYSKFEEDLTWKEQLLIAKYNVQYNTFKSKTEIIDFYNLFIKEDYEELKKQIKEYSENDMKEDMQFLIEQANEIGEDAIKAIEDIMKELDINIEDFEK